MYVCIVFVCVFVWGGSWFKQSALAWAKSSSDYVLLAPKLGSHSCPQFDILCVCLRTKEEMLFDSRIEGCGLFN